MGRRISGEIIDGASVLHLKDHDPDLELGLIYASANRDIPLLQGFLGVIAQVAG
jgi:hypothetical protein